jgi:predicted signal transduction protein with EAL and GGDEF domain
VPTHKVRTHRWINGFLEVVEHFFENEADALYHARTATTGSVKVFDTTENTIIHSQNNSASARSESYA